MNMLHKNIPDLNRSSRSTSIDGLSRPPRPQAAVPAGWQARQRASRPQTMATHTVRVREMPAVRAHQSMPQQPIARRPATIVSQQRKSQLPISSVVTARRRPLLVVFAVVIFSFVLIHSLAGNGKFAEALSAITTTQAEKDAAARAERLATYKTTVDKIVAAHPDQNIAVSSIDLNDNSLTTLGDTGTFTGASTAKLITAIAVLHQVETGSMKLTDKVGGVNLRTLLSNMIINSDNTAWEQLNAKLTHETLATYTTSLGWTDYDPDVNTFQPADMARLMQQLYEGKLLDSTDTHLLLALMQQANKQDYIVDSVTAAGSGYTVYHKAGWLDGLMHDVAIIKHGDHTIVLTIYTYSSNNNGDTIDNQATFKAITDAALQAYFPPEPAS